jgi:hypothetical protein
MFSNFTFMFLNQFFKLFVLFLIEIKIILTFLLIFLAKIFILKAYLNFSVKFSNNFSIPNLKLYKFYIESLVFFTSNNY